MTGLTMTSTPLPTVTDVNILEHDLRGINTWPFSRRPWRERDPHEREFIKEIRETTRGEMKRNLERIPSELKNLKDKQILVVSWFLAAILGVLGNFAVNLFFSPISFNIFAIYLVLISTILVACVIILLMFTYFPPRLSFLIDFSPRCFTFFIQPRIDENLLNSKAKNFVTDVDAFAKTMMKYIDVIIRAILRDSVNGNDIRYLKIIEVEKIFPGTERPSETHYTLDVSLPSYAIKVDFKRAYSFWRPRISKAVRPELHRIVDSIYGANSRIADYTLENNHSVWRQKGVAFLNSISRWKFEDLAKKLERQVERGRNLN